MLISTVEPLLISVLLLISVPHLAFVLLITVVLLLVSVLLLIIVPPLIFVLLLAAVRLFLFQLPFLRIF